MASIICSSAHSERLGQTLNRNKYAC